MCSLLKSILKYGLQINEKKKKIKQELLYGLSGTAVFCFCLPDSENLWHFPFITVDLLDNSTIVEYNNSTIVEDKCAVLRQFSERREKMRDIKRLPESELEIMQIIWKQDPPVTRADIEDALSEIHPLAPTTILTLLTRLCEKGFLLQSKDGRTNLYEPLISEKEYLAVESRSFLDRLFGGSIAGFATALCDGGIDKEELDELRRLLEKGEL